MERRDSTGEEKPMKPIDQQIVFVTGSTDGLGKQTAYTLAAQGATVLLHGRSRERFEAALQEIRHTTGTARLEAYLADLSELSQVHSLAEEVPAHQARLDLLINDAGIGAGKRTGTRELSQDGYELRFAVNYLAPFLLTHSLLPCLRRAAPARIVVTVKAEGREQEALAILIRNGANNANIPNALEAELAPILGREAVGPARQSKQPIDARSRDSFFEPPAGPDSPGDPESPLNASRQALRNHDTMGKSVWKIEEKEGTYDSPNHFTPIRYSNPCRVAPPL